MHSEPSAAAPADHPAGDATVRAALRRATRASHARLDDALDLRSGAIGASRLIDLVRALGAFWEAGETRIESWADAHHRLATALRWNRRRRHGAAVTDLQALGAESLHLPPVQPMLGQADTAAILGHLYVREGATLGGAVLHRGLAARASRGRLLTFFPYDEGPGPMWQGFTEVVEAWAGTDVSRRIQIATSAVQTFDALEAHLRRHGCIAEPGHGILAE